ncbi:MAG: hypothetical protein ACLRSJ_00465 [Agathobaculum sp.]
MLDRMDQNLSILTERQRQVYLLRQQGARLGTSAASAGKTYHTAYRRLRDAAILLEAPPRTDARPVDFPLTRGELEAIAGALSLLNREMCRKAGLSAAPSDPLPPRIAQVSALLHRARQALEEGKSPMPPRKGVE